MNKLDFVSVSIAIIALLAVIAMIDMSRRDNITRHNEQSAVCYDNDMNYRRYYSQCTDQAGNHYDIGRLQEMQL